MNLERNIAVLDLKAFYSFVECLDRGLDPFKTSLVVADISRSPNTIVLSVSPFLKSKGVPSRCRVKELPKSFKYIYATPRMARYIEMSSKVVSIILSFVAKEDIHVYSIDEAFIDMTSYLSYYKKTPVEFVEMIIKKINDETGLMATGGIGDNFFLAKVALDVFAKHEKNGIAVLRQKEIKEKMWPITPLTKIWGIGPRLEIRLNKLGIYTLGDLATSDKDFIISKFGIMGEQMHNHANGIDEADVHEVYIPKEHSLNIGQVLPRDYNAIETQTIIREMIDDLSFRMREEGKLTNVCGLYIGYSIEGGFARQMSLLSPTDNADELFKACLEIYKKHIDESRAIRRVGIGFGKLEDDMYRQLNLFEDGEQQIKVQDMQKAIDNLHKKYGKNSVLRASALMEGSTAVERHNQIGGHRK